MKKTEFISIFPNVRSEAFYNPFAQYIGINKFSIKEFEKYTAEGIKIENIEFYKTLIHEARHYDDHLTTLWGQKNLIACYNAIIARLTSNPSKFHYIVSYLRENQRQSFKDYYSFVQNKIKPTNNNERWKWSMSCGLRFDKNGYLNENFPILFINFNSHDDKPIARAPITIESLLETNAVNDEAKAHIAHVFNLPPGPIACRISSCSTRFYI